MTGWGANYRRGNLREVWLGPKTRVLDGHTLPPGCCRPWLLCLFPRASPPSTTVPTHTHTHINIYMYINKHTHMHAATRDLQVVEQYWWQKYMTPRPEIAPMRAANETHADQHRIRTIKSTGANVSQWMNKNTHTDPLSPCLHQEQPGRLLLGYMNMGLQQGWVNFCAQEKLIFKMDRWPRSFAEEGLEGWGVLKYWCTFFATWKDVTSWSKSSSKCCSK